MSRKIVQLNEEVIKELVRGSVEEALNELLEMEAEKLTQAARCERSEAPQGCRSGHYDRTSANVHDVTAAAKLLREDDEVVYGDSAYLGLEKRDEIKQNPRLSSIEFRINRRPGRLPRVSNKAIDCERCIENRKSSVRFFHA